MLVQSIVSIVNLFSVCWFKVWVQLRTCSVCVGSKYGFNCEPVQCVFVHSMDSIWNLFSVLFQSMSSIENLFSVLVQSMGSIVNPFSVCWFKVWVQL